MHGANMMEESRVDTHIDCTY